MVNISLLTTLLVLQVNIFDMLGFYHHVKSLMHPPKVKCNHSKILVQYATCSIFQYQMNLCNFVKE